MFIIKPITKEEATGELKTIYKIIKKKLGFVPPHFELLGTLDISKLKDFLQYNEYMTNHPKIDADILPILRLYIATKECRSYCIGLNTKLLLAKGIDVKNINDNLSSIVFKDNQKLLLDKTIKAIYDTENFGADDLGELYKADFSDKDFFDILGYTINFMSNSKIIEVYLRK
ncbi:MAG: hypothetical protein WC253_00390 [Sulfurovaceae bacterium]|nr:hypothetical protein [Sulfurovaceae bacterium]